MLFISASADYRGSWWFFFDWSGEAEAAERNVSQVPIQFLMSASQKTCLFPWNLHWVYTSPFWPLDSFISHLGSLTVVGTGQPTEVHSLWTKAGYVKAMSCGQRYHLKRRCWTHPLCASSMSRTAATTKSETFSQKCFLKMFSLPKCFLSQWFKHISSLRKQLDFR